MYAIDVHERSYEKHTVKIRKKIQ